MNKTAIAFLTKNRVDLSCQSVVPLLQLDKFDLFWIDGSVTEEGRGLPRALHGSTKKHRYHANLGVRGGAGAAIVFALTKMLEGNYEYVGLCENDVLCDPSWFDLCFGLFSRGHHDGLDVGAVSARCYEDRVLFQRDGYAVCHNLGAGLVLFKRAAAQLVLSHFRSGWTTDNRRVFCQLSGVDIGSFWAFRGGDHNLVADWHFDTVLAAHGYSSLALTPSPVEMIGQDPPLEQQGLKIATGPVTARIDSKGFEQYRYNLAAVREGRLRIPVETKFQYNNESNSWTYLPHQLHMLGGKFEGDWRFKEMRAFGEFGWVAGTSNPAAMEGKWEYPESVPSFSVPVFGNAMLLMSGGEKGGQVHVVDEQSGYEIEPFIAPEGETKQCLQIPLPATINQRTIRVTCKAPGICFYRLVTKEPQPFDPKATFDYSNLPEPV